MAWSRLLAALLLGALWCTAIALSLGGRAQPAWGAACVVVCGGLLLALWLLGRLKLARRLGWVFIGLGVLGVGLWVASYVPGEPAWGAWWAVVAVLGTARGRTWWADERSALEPAAFGGIAALATGAALALAPRFARDLWGCGLFLGLAVVVGAGLVVAWRVATPDCLPLLRPLCAACGVLAGVASLVGVGYGLGLSVPRAPDCGMWFTVVGLLAVIALLVGWADRPQNRLRYPAVVGWVAVLSPAVALAFAVCYFGWHEGTLGPFFHPKSADPALGFGTYVYFSMVLGGAVGFGEYFPAHGLPRLAVCLHMGVQWLVLSTAAWVALTPPEWEKTQGGPTNGGRFGEEMPPPQPEDPGTL